MSIGRHPDKNGDGGSRETYTTNQGQESVEGLNRPSKLEEKSCISLNHCLIRTSRVSGQHDWSWVC